MEGLSFDRRVGEKMEHLTYEELYDYLNTDDIDLQEHCEEHLMECEECICKLQKVTKVSQQMPMLGTQLEALNHKSELTAAYQYRKNLEVQAKPTLRERILNLILNQSQGIHVLMKSERFHGISGIFLNSLEELTPLGRLKPELLTATRGTTGQQRNIASVLKSMDSEQTYIKVDGQNQRVVLSLADNGGRREQPPVGILLSKDWRQDAVMQEAEWNEQANGYQLQFEKLASGEYQLFLLQ